MSKHHFPDLCFLMQHPALLYDLYDEEKNNKLPIYTNKIKKQWIIKASIIEIKAKRTESKIKYLINQFAQTAHSFYQPNVDLNSEIQVGSRELVHSKFN